MYAPFLPTLYVRNAWGEFHYMWHKHLGLKHKLIRIWDCTDIHVNNNLQLVMAYNLNVIIQVFLLLLFFSAQLTLSMNVIHVYFIWGFVYGGHVFMAKMSSQTQTHTALKSTWPLLSIWKSGGQLVSHYRNLEKIQDSRFKGFIVMSTVKKHVPLYNEILSLLSTPNT